MSVSGGSPGGHREQLLLITLAFMNVPFLECTCQLWQRLQVHSGAACKAVSCLRPHFAAAQDAGAACSWVIETCRHLSLQMSREIASGGQL